MIKAVTGTLAVIGTLGVTTAAAAGAGGQTLHNAESFTLKPGVTEKITVPYPFAMRFTGSHYSGSVSGRGFRILSEGSCQGGDDFCVRVHNGGGSPARGSVTAYTRLPAHV